MTAYDILGISPTANKGEIKRAFRKLSMIYHPDMPTGNNEKFISIKSAYESLMTFDPTTVHQQYQHRTTPFTNFNAVYIDKNGDCKIDITFRNIIWIEGTGVLKNTHHWTTELYNGGILTIEKKALIKCGYKFTLKFQPAIGRSVLKEFIFDKPPTKFQKFIGKLYTFLYGTE